MNYKHEIEQLMERVQRLEHLVNELRQAGTGAVPEETSSPKKKMPSQKKLDEPKQSGATRRPKKSAKSPSTAGKSRRK